MPKPTKISNSKLQHLNGNEPEKKIIINDSIENEEKKRSRKIGNSVDSVGRQAGYVCECEMNASMNTGIRMKLGAMRRNEEKISNRKYINEEKMTLSFFPSFGVRIINFDFFFVSNREKQVSFFVDSNYARCVLNILMLKTKV